MSVKFYHAHPAVRADAGKVALMRGPVVYCLEGVDNGPALHDLTVDTHSAAEEQFDPRFGMPVLKVKGTASALSAQEPLYTDAPAGRKDTVLTFIPYYGFANRGESDMAVWVRT